MDKKKHKISQFLAHFRGWIQAVATILTNIHLPNFFKGEIYRGDAKTVCVPGLNCYSCPAATGACPIGAFQAVIGSSKFKFSYYITGFFILIGVLLGRFVCGFLCPFGWFQELLHKIPFKKFSTKKLKPLRYIKYGVLLIFVILLPLLVTNSLGMGNPFFCKYLCPQGVLEGAIPLSIANASIRAALGKLFTWKFGILITFVILSLMFYRPFCKWICPLGAIYALCNKVSFLQMKVDEDKCVSCGKCERACKMDVDVTKHPNHTECIRCGMCIKECPTEAIHYQYGIGTGKTNLKENKMKKLTVMLLIAAMVLGVSACGNSANKENTATESQMSTQEAEDLDAKINELTQKENSILENHKALWEKVFNSIDKSTVEDATATNYGDFLANSLDKIKDKFTDDELKSLKEDVEEIKKLEDELQPLLEKQSANASNKDSGKEGASVFPEFKAKDLDGNDVDSSIISKNAVTVLNFWFNGCSPCVQELPELNKLNEELKEKGGQVIGINTDSLDGNEDGIAEAKSILEKQGAKYTNLSLDSNSEAGKYATSIMAFPTTIVLDRNGNIIGEPIMGGIDNDESYKQLMKTIDQILAADKN